MGGTLTFPAVRFPLGFAIVHRAFGYTAYSTPTIPFVQG